MTEIRIHDILIPPGEAVHLKIPISRLPSHTLIDLPVFVFRGTAPGPNLLLSAGIHGDEINDRKGRRRACLDCGRSLEGELPDPCSASGKPHLSQVTT